MKITLNRAIRDERGQALIMVLVLLLLGGLVIAPLLSFMSTGIVSGQVYEAKMGGLYAADAGIEDALWKIKTDAEDLPELGDDPREYWITTEDYKINGEEVAYEITQVWVLDGIEETKHGQTPHDELVAVGGIVDLDTGRYRVEVTYDGSQGNVTVNRMGVWLPLDFEYDDNSSEGITTDNPTISDARAGITLIWDDLDITFPPNEITTAYQYFDITPVGADPSGDFSWARTSRADIYLSWNADFVNYIVTATATDSDGKQTEVEAYVFRRGEDEVGIITWEVDPQ